jgi:hypothetical protein
MAAYLKIENIGTATAEGFTSVLDAGVMLNG